MIFLTEYFPVNCSGILNDRMSLVLCARLALIHVPLDRVNIDPYSLKNGLPPPLTLLYPKYAG
jgi:hypothetical protein